MYALRPLIAAILFSSLACAQDNSWNKVRYNGGTVQTKVDPHDWDNHLSVTTDLIKLRLKDGQTVDIPARNVTGLSYGQEAHRRLSTVIVLFGLLHKSRLHFIGIEYTTNGRRDGLLLQGDKDDYRAILVALEDVTRAPISVSEKDREFLPDTLQATVVKEGDEGEGKTSARKEGGTVSLTSKPSGADVYVDNAFAGNTPCTIAIDTGKHTVKLTAKDYLVWSRELKIREGSEMSINATMEK